MLEVSSQETRSYGPSRPDLFSRVALSMTDRAIRANASDVWHLAREVKGRMACECGAALGARFELCDVALLYDAEFCQNCVVLAEADPVPVVAELTRQGYQKQRQTILKELQKFIRQPESAQSEIEKIADSEFDSVLTP